VRLLNTTSREERNLSVFENMILKQKLGRKMDGKREWRRLHNEELQLT
jgi:hypothetical protein